MSISSIGTSGAYQYGAVSSVSGRPAPPAGMPDPRELLRGQEVDGLDLSDPGQLFRQLEELAQQDPEQLKEVLSDIADRIRSVADGADDPSSDATSGAMSGATSSASSQFPSRLADRFDEAAETGDLSSLRPLRPPLPPGRGGSRAEQAYRSAAQAGSPLAKLFGAGDSDSSSADVQQRITELRAQIAQLMSQSQGA
jgi:hypothetical protein